MWQTESDSLTWFQKFCINVLKCGPVPRHLAIIMDGNRRYATKHQMEKQFGHEKGSDKLENILKWGAELGIREITVYAFSIENFKRSPEEVAALMKLTSEKLKRFLERKYKLMDGGVRFRAIGNLELLPNDIRKLIAESTLMSKNNKRVILNFAISYTSLKEITNAIKIANAGVYSECLEIEDVDEELLSNCMYTNHSQNPDVLIRTSGETRLSDFLLWQISHTYIFFADALWPEFTIWHLFALIFNYQRSHSELKQDLNRHNSNNLNERKHKFLDNLEKTRLSLLKCYECLR